MIKKRSSVKVQGGQPLNAIKACNTFSSANSLYGQLINTTFTYSVTERFVNQQKKKGYEKNPENVLSLLELLHHKSDIGSRKMFQK